MRKIHLSSRILSVFICVLLLVTGLAIHTSAEDMAWAQHTVFSGSRVIEGWYPSFITQYKAPDEMSSFLAAIKKDGAIIEVTYSGNADISILLQSYPSGGDHYPWVIYDKKTVQANGSQKVASFDAEGLIDKYTSAIHDDDGSNLRLDNVLNFGIGGEGNTVYSVAVKWMDYANPGINVDLSKRYQTMDGWGASYTWYGDWLVNNNYREQGFDWIFNDCEFNILRFRDLNKVRGYGGGFEDTSYKAYKTYYDAAVARGIDPIVLVTSWGQYTRELDFVQFIEKDDQGHAYYTLAKDGNGNYMYEALADFCVQSIQYFIDAGIPVDYFSISNETELQGIGKDENGNAVNEAGFFFGTEENQYHCAYWKAHIAIYNAFQEAFGSNAPNITGAEVMADYASTIGGYVDPLIKAAPYTFDTIAHHLYGSANTPQTFSEVNSRYGNYTLWQTEWYNNNLLDHANVLINELKYENISAYLYWNGVWIEDTGNCLIEIGDWVPNAYIKRRGNHYIMMHFSKFIKRGYTRVEAETNVSNSNAVSFISPDGTELVTVVLNNSSTSESLNLRVKGYDVTSTHAYRTTKYTDDQTREVELNDYMRDIGMISYENISIPANTLTTLVSTIKKSEMKGDCGAEGDNLTWYLSEDGVLTISGTGYMADYEAGKAPWLNCDFDINKIVISTKVLSIGSNAFNGCDKLESVFISYGVSKIGENAFTGCSSLTSVNIPQSVSIIGDGAFGGCTGLISARILSPSVEIGSGAFASCPWLVLTGYADTSSENYANSNGVQFISMGTFEVVIGDLDCDGVVGTLNDVMLLERYIAGWPGCEFIIPQTCDIDADGEIATPTDAIILARYCADWEGYESIPFIK